MFRKEIIMANTVFNHLIISERKYAQKYAEHTLDYGEFYKIMCRSRAGCVIVDWIDYI